MTEEEIIELDCIQRVATQDKAADEVELKPNLDPVLEEWKSYCHELAGAARAYRADLGRSLTETIGERERCL